MALPEFTMRQLLEAGVHFGHQTRRWNPKMRPYLFGARNGVHVIDLEQTVPLLHQALVTLRDVAAGGGRILFVGTKRQASRPIAETARRCGQYYVNHRWLGGMLTNWKAISGSIKTLADLEATLADESAGLTKKEMLQLVRRRNKLDLALGGIRDMGGVRTCSWSSTPTRKTSRYSRHASWASRWSRSSTATAIPISSPTRSPATTTRSARSISTATSSPAPSSTDCRWSLLPPVPTSAPPRRDWPRTCHRSKRPRPRKRRPMAEAAAEAPVEAPADADAAPESSDASGAPDASETPEAADAAQAAEASTAPEGGEAEQAAGA